MKKQALTLLAMASLSLVLAVVPAYADPDSEVRANVPFGFIVGDTTYPSGTYAVQYTNPKGVILFHIVEDETRHNLLWYNTVPAKSMPEHSPKLFFNRYGDQYFLNQVSAGGDIDARELKLKSPRERKLVIEYLAMNISVPQVVSIAATLQSLPVESAGRLLDGISSASVTNSTLHAQGIQGNRVVTNWFGPEYRMMTGGQLTRVSKWELQVLF